MGASDDREKIKVYRRENRSKLQLFTIRSDLDGLSRTFDSRGNRICINAIKFPLGNWREGETRKFSFNCWKTGRLKRRKVEITIEKIDFTYDGVDHALRYRWVADGGGKRGLDMVYTYAPGLGNSKVVYSD